MALFCMEFLQMYKLKSKEIFENWFEIKFPIIVNQGFSFRLVKNLIVSHWKIFTHLTFWAWICMLSEICFWPFYQCASPGTEKVEKEEPKQFYPASLAILCLCLNETFKTGRHAWNTPNFRSWNFSLSNCRAKQPFSINFNFRKGHSFYKKWKSW